ncbi:MAG: DUF4133 domain-containing protein [Ferruginibacter sp.]
MNNSIYQINKGINKPIEFKGLKAQYIWYLGAGLIGLLIVFAVMYITGINTFVCLGLILLLGSWLFTRIYKLSHTYGEYGMMKMLAKKRIPHFVKSRSRRYFVDLRKTQ